MTILLGWLVDNAWVFYAVCALGVIIYLVRALTAQRERRLSMFTLERETATSRLIQAWLMILVFVAMGAVILVSTKYVLPALPVLSPDESPRTPTSAAGVDPPTPGPTPTVTAEPLVPTFTPPATADSDLAPAPAPTLEATETSTLTPTVAPDAPDAPVAGEVRVRFGDFAELAGYSLSGTEVTTAQPVPLTLYWQALEGSSTTDYMVFTHLLAEDGHLVAQHDSPPANGARPIASWSPGESIVDPHSMAFQDTAYTGPATIVVGLYDLTTGERVLTDMGSSHVVLAAAISVVPQ